MGNKLLKERIYEGIIREIGKNNARVSIFDGDRNEIEAVFSFNSFKGWVPEAGNSVRYHALQLKNKKYDGYFERGKSRKLKLSDFEPEKVRKFKKYFKLS